MKPEYGFVLCTEERAAHLAEPPDRLPGHPQHGKNQDADRPAAPSDWRPMHSMHGEGQLADQSEELPEPRDRRPLRTCQFYRNADARTLEADSDAEDGAAFAFGLAGLFLLFPKKRLRQWGSYFVSRN